MAKVYTWAEVAKHTTPEDCWVVVNGQVLDVTSFLPDHPGGVSAITSFAGKDASDEFNLIHQKGTIKKYASECILGRIEAGPPPAPSASPASAPASKPAASAAAPITPSSAPEKLHPGQVTAHWTQPNNPMSLAPLQVAVPSDTPSRNSGGTALVLGKERKKASFDIETMTNVLDGGVQKTKRRRFIIGPGKDVDVSDRYVWERPTLMKEHVRHFLGMHEPFAGKFIPTREDVTWMQENSMISGALMNHYGLFMPTVLSQSNDEQLGWWLPRAMTFKIIGCYAQTELGHGSNVRGLQTVAIYDKATQEFVINTPTLLSIKWWPGAMGKVATHAVVYAQLVIDGKEYGVHIFMVQIRDEHHRPLPGIEVGDLGPKLGDGANDTGFMRLENIRIPLDHMLAKYQHVTPEGKYVKSAGKTSDKIHYATMMFTRGAMVRGAGGQLARAVTIAIRYSAIRRQGFVDPGSNSFQAEERSIIDHQVQRYRLFKQLALSYAMKFCGKWMVDRFAALEGGTAGVITDTSQLGEIAATSAGLKGLCTFLAAQGIEDCRKCCGGNGYLLASGVAQQAIDYVWQTTAEGDWIILMLQTARFLMKSVQSAQKGEPLTGPCAYMAVLKDTKLDLKKLAPKPTKVDDFYDLNFLKTLFQYRSLVCVVRAAQSLREKKGMSEDDAWNANALQLVNCVVVHSHAFILDNFVHLVAEVKDEKCKRALSRLCALYATSEIIDGNWTGFLDIDGVVFVRQAIAQLLDEIRPDAVALVDAFDIPDRVLNSALGGYDGNVYEALYEYAKKSNLNHVDPFDGYHEHLKRHLDIEFLQTRNGKIPSHL